MSTIIISVVVSVVGLAVGFFIGKQFSQNKAKQLEEEARKQAEILLREAKAEAESQKKDKMLEAKEHFLKLKSEHEESTNNRNKKLQERENNLRSKEQSLSSKIEHNTRKEKELEGLKENLSRQLELVNTKREEMEKHQSVMIKQLEQIASLTAPEAKEELVQLLKEEARSESMAYVKQVMDEAKISANKEAKKIIIQTIQRTAAEHTIENTVSVFNLTSDDQKGQIIGREGRNIRAIEAATGVEIIVDDTPEAIIISGFDPLRREIARLSLQRLVADGRIHPARIEEIVNKTRKQLEDQIMEIGERTVVELGIHGMKPELIRMVGKMRFRSSYGQNLLQHSKETARLCATMAGELGLPQKMVAMAKRAGLLHDIGKVPDDESDLTHAILGMKLCEKHGEHPAICNAVGAHHDEIEMTFLISPIIQACDAISGARPGARREMMESYIQRLKELENLAMSYEGVEKAYAIQAGRELRIMVESEKVTDQRADELSFEIAQKIQNEMTYPGQIKVNVIREKRSVAFAK